MIIRPSRPFWSGFTAFTANMVALVGVDKLPVTEPDIQVQNWWLAAVLSLLVAGVVYGKEKIAESKTPERRNPAP
jgi:hypothetical protein